MTQLGARRQSTDVGGVAGRIDRLSDRVEREMMIRRWMLLPLAMALMAKLAFT